MTPGRSWLQRREAVNFDVLGPFKLERHGKRRLITEDSRKALKSEMEDAEEGLSIACGCYVFAKVAGKGITPWYVGQACVSALGSEALNATNRERYNQVLDAKGSPVMYFLPM